MKVKIQKQGNYLVLRIPKTLAAELDIRQGSVVDVSFKHRRLAIDSSSEPAYSLEELLAGVTTRNLHAEIPTSTSKSE